MSERRYIVATAALTAIGLGIAAYLTFAHYAGPRIACPTSGCETVQASAYADVFGVPIALLGLIAYAGILAALALPRDIGRWLVPSLAVAGTVFSAYLVLVQAIAVGAFCAWCLASDAVIFTIAGLAFLHAFRDAA